MMRRFLVAVGWLMVTGCTSTYMLFPVRYEVIDHPEEGAIEVKFHNEYPFPVCFSRAAWPNQAGRFDSAKGWVFLKVGDMCFTVEDVAEYCPRCVTVVAPGETLSTLVPYEEFHLPLELYPEKKELLFAPYASRCDAEELRAARRR